MSVYVPPPLAVGQPATSSAKAGPIGPGAGVLMTEHLLSHLLPSEPNRRMRAAWRIGEACGYVYAAERVISGRIAGLSAQYGFEALGWHLEDPDGETIDEEYPDAAAREAYTLLARPMGALTLDEAGGYRQTRRQQWELLSRHMGLCGTSFLLADGLSGYGTPRALLYCRPDRITPETKGPIGGGVLTGWRLDKGSSWNIEGTPLSLSEVLPFYLQAPNEGYLATGLVDAALAKAQLNGTIDRYWGQIIAGGGRLSGILAPRQGRIDDDNEFEQLKRDWRNITEQPESARRLQVVRAPVDFTRTVNNPSEMGLADLMGRNRDDLLAIWGVPYSQLGGSPAAGLGQGEARDSDRQALWENAIGPRLSEMGEVLQSLLERWEPVLGWAPTLVFDLPDLEPEATKYDRAKKVEGVAMRNSERRALVGLDPFGPEVLGTTGSPLDDEVWVPVTIQPMGAAVEGEQPIVVQEAAEELPAIEEEGLEEGLPEAAAGSPAGKARTVRAGMGALRASVERRIVPALTSRVERVIRQQRRDVSAAVERNWSAITREPRNTSHWWRTSGAAARRGQPYDAELTEALRPALAGVAKMVAGHVADTLGGAGKAASDDARRRASQVSEGAVARMLRAGAGRVTRINRDMRDDLRELIASAVRDGLSPAEAGRRVREWMGWGEYRAERIARTELMFAYNDAALGTYGEYGVERVQAIDGDEDEECRERNGREFTIEEAAGIIDHPNGTLDWVPVLS